VPSITPSPEHLVSRQLRCDIGGRVYTGGTRRTHHTQALCFPPPPRPFIYHSTTWPRAYCSRTGRRYSNCPLKIFAAFLYLSCIFRGHAYSSPAPTGYLLDYLPAGPGQFGAGRTTPFIADAITRTVARLAQAVHTLRRGYTRVTLPFLCLLLTAPQRLTHYPAQATGVADALRHYPPRVTNSSARFATLYRPPLP